VVALGPHAVPGQPVGHLDTGVPVRCGARPTGTACAGATDPTLRQPLGSRPCTVAFRDWRRPGPARAASADSRTAGPPTEPASGAASPDGPVSPCRSKNPVSMSRPGTPGGAARALAARSGTGSTACARTGTAVNVLRHPAFLAGESTPGSSPARADRAVRLAAPLAGSVGVRRSGCPRCRRAGPGRRQSRNRDRAGPAAQRLAQRRVRAPAQSGSGWPAPHRTGRRRYRGGLTGDPGRRAGRGYHGVALVSSAPGQVVLDVDGLRRSFTVAHYEGLSR